MNPCDTDPDACVCDDHVCPTCEGVGEIDASAETIYGWLSVPIPCPDCEGPR